MRSRDPADRPPRADDRSVRKQQPAVTGPGRGEAIAALAGARTAEAIVPAIEPDDRYPGIARREATDVAASRCRQRTRQTRGPRKNESDHATTPPTVRDWRTVGTGRPSASRRLHCAAPLHGTQKRTAPALAANRCARRAFSL